VLALSKSSRRSVVGTVFQCMSTAAPRHFKMRSPYLGEGGAVVATLSPLNNSIDVNRHPFFVFGKRRVGLLQITDFTHIVRRTTCVGEKVP
jgi:hypothetical protein